MKTRIEKSSIQKAVDESPDLKSKIHSFVNSAILNSSLAVKHLSDNNNIVSSIFDTFTTNYNIIKVDKTIRTFLEHNSKTREEEIKKEIYDYTVVIDGLDGKKHNIIDVKYSKRMRSELEEKLVEIGGKLEEYIRRASPFLVRYQDLPQVPPTNPFSSEEPRIDTERLKVILGYLDIARDYFNINVVHKQKSLPICNYCSGKLVEETSREINGDGIMICQNCFSVHTLANKPTSCREGGNRNDFYANMGTNDYIPEENALLTFRCYQGAEVIQDKEMVLEECRAYLINKRRVKDLTKVDRQMLYEALSETNPKYYRHIRQIGKDLCEWKLPDISHLEKPFLNYNRRIDERFEMLKQEYGEGRDSSMNVEYKTYRILSDLLKHPCQPTEFKIPKTPNILRFHEKMWRLICEAESTENEKWKPGNPIIL